MAQTKNLCAQIPLDLHAQVCEAREAAGQTTSEYITQLLIEYYDMKKNGGYNRRVYAYLRKRGIASQVINGFIQAGLLYEDAQYHNCVFIGRNSTGQPVFANKRGTYDRDGAGFKGDVSGSNKAVGFRLFCDPAKPEVYVFEAPIDLMSFCTLHREITHNAVALCCLYDGALETYLKENPSLKQIVLCLDADQPGRIATELLKAKYAQKGYIVTVQQPPVGKDWNECLLTKHHERGDAAR